jgi:hypothetical protein
MITTRYRFYVGLTDKDRALVKPERYFHAMDAVLTSYTFFSAGGVWKGDHEQNMVFEVLATDDTHMIPDERVRAIAGFLRVAGNQETVMVTVDRSVEVLFFS